VRPVWNSPWRRCGVAFFVLAGIGTRADPADLVWPTPNRAADEHRPYAEFVQPTESGLVESGLFGCVRTNGHQFHEGLDLRPVQRDQRGEAADSVFAMLPGVVRHANTAPGASNYGRYVVLEHQDDGLSFISLYAHLLTVAAEVRSDVRLPAGQTIGIMGRSAGARPIPKNRAHVHVETGFWLTRDFQRWYDQRKFPNANEHGVFNGMNIVSFDFLDFVEHLRAGDVRTVREYVLRQPTAATVVVRSKRVPDFVTRHPGLVTAPLEDIAGWQIEFTWYGLPKAWRPLGAEDPAVATVTGRAIVFAEAALLERFPCQKVVSLQGGAHVPGPKLQEILDLLFTGP
jgi:peptidoglycan LD-endopeptidase LytH